MRTARFSGRLSTHAPSHAAPLPECALHHACPLHHICSPSRNMLPLPHTPFHLACLPFPCMPPFITRAPPPFIMHATHAPFTMHTPFATNIPPPMNRITDMCKNITFPQLRLRVVMEQLLHCFYCSYLSATFPDAVIMSDATHTHTR